jgi:nuclear transport factor 2 (NTF2) superfamily protein
MTALVPPFTRETAISKERMAQDDWNSRDPHRLSLKRFPPDLTRRDSQRVKDERIFVH